MFFYPGLGYHAWMLSTVLTRLLLALYCHGGIPSNDQQGEAEFKRKKNAIVE